MTLTYNQERIQDLELPTNPNFRQFKLIMEDGSALKIPRIVKTPKDLEKFLIKKQPIGLYVSVSKFLSPHKVGAKRKNWKKAGYKYAENIFISGGLVIDFDEQEFSEVQKSIEWLAINHGLEQFQVIETGRGWHLWCNDFENKCIKRIIPNPFERENHYTQVKRKILIQLEQSGRKFDFNVSLDTRRIVRVPNSIYRKNGIEKICKILYSLPSGNARREREGVLPRDQIAFTGGRGVATDSLIGLSCNEPSSPQIKVIN